LTIGKRGSAIKIIARVPLLLFLLLGIIFLSTSCQKQISEGTHSDISNVQTSTLDISLTAASEQEIPNKQPSELSTVIYSAKEKTLLLDMGYTDSQIDWYAKNGYSFSQTEYANGWILPQNTTKVLVAALRKDSPSVVAGLAKKYQYSSSEMAPFGQNYLYEKFGIGKVWIWSLGGASNASNVPKNTNSDNGKLFGSGTYAYFVLKIGQPFSDAEIWEISASCYAKTGWVLDEVSLGSNEEATELVNEWKLNPFRRFSVPVITSQSSLADYHISVLLPDLSSDEKIRELNTFKDELANRIKEAGEFGWEVVWIPNQSVFPEN
jgi:hypothetical protein